MESNEITMSTNILWDSVPEANDLKAKTNPQIREYVAHIDSITMDVMNKCFAPWGLLPMEIMNKLAKSQKIRYLKKMNKASPCLITKFIDPAK